MDVLLHAGHGGGWWSYGCGCGLTPQDGRLFRDGRFLRGELDALAVVDGDVVGRHLRLLDLDVAFAGFTDPR